MIYFNKSDADFQVQPICPIVNICMPVYNGERFLRRSLDSLLKQTFTNFELIISDNASTDGTQAICEEYAMKDIRIKYMRQQFNLGAAANYNFLMDQVRARYFFFAPHDDEWLPSWIETAVKVLDEDLNASIAIGTILFVDRDGYLVAMASPPWQLDQDSPAIRIAHYLNTEVTDHLLYGVMRYNSVKKFRLGLGETSPERALIFTILATGKVVDAPQMQMINYMSHKTRGELYEFFKFKRWYWANLKTHLSTIRAFIRELPSRDAAMMGSLYFSEIINRKLFRKNKKHGNVHFFHRYVFKKEL
jgi:glycosyltransferase involved in cell wall biosynthesis